MVEKETGKNWMSETPTVLRGVDFRLVALVIFLIIHKR